MITEPKMEERPEQPYMGIRVQVPMKHFEKVIPQTLGEVYAWLGKQGVSDTSAPFVRFHIINMESDMDIEMGVPVAKSLPGDGRIKPGVIPAGRYATLVYTGLQNGIEANAALLDWGKKQGLKWDTYESDKGDGFVARLEFTLTDPQDESDQTNWETEVAIRLADE